MISARTQSKPGMAMVQYQLFPELTGDCRLLVPGWAGELNPTELEHRNDLFLCAAELAPPISRGQSRIYTMISTPAGPTL